MRRAGLKLMAGTDANGSFPSLIPGISLHEELRLFVEAGYKPAEALRHAARSTRWRGDCLQERPARPGGQQK